jgi:hypothetical protein
MSRPTLNKPFEIAQIYQSLSTGLISGMELSINADNTKFDIGPGSGYCVDNTTVPDSPTVKKVIFDGLTAQNVTNIAAQLVTYISINSDGEIIQESHIPDGEDRRDRIFIGVLVHTDNVHIEVVNNTPTLAIDTDAQLQDLMNSLGIFNIYGNSVRSFNGDLRITKTQGDIFRVGGNFQNNMKSPHKLTLPAQNPITNIQYRTQTGEVYDPSGFLDPGYYDVAGTRTALSNSSKASNQRVYVFPSGIIRIQYGQVEYNSISAAVEGLSTENYIVESNLSENALLLCTISILAGATSTSDVDDAIFIPAGKWGDVSNTGSTAVGDLQQIYNNSTVKPQIVVSNIGGIEISDENDLGNDVLSVGKVSDGNITSFEDDGSIRQEGTAKRHWTKYIADSITVNAGIPTGTVADLQAEFDGNSLYIQEASSTPGMLVIVDFIDVSAFNWVNILLAYNGGTTHYIAVEMWNWTTSTWDCFGSTKGNGALEANTNNSFFVHDCTNYIGTDANSGETRVRLNHAPAGNASHNMTVEVVSLYQ